MSPLRFGALSFLCIFLTASAAYALPNSSCIYALGDSLTSAYAPELAAALPERKVINAGLGGQGSASVAARTGATPIQVTIENNILPETGSALVTTISPDPLAFSGKDSFEEGVIAGVAGQLTWNRYLGYRFRRLAPGPVTRVEQKTDFVVDRSLFRDCILILWVGRNDYEYAEIVQSNIKAIVDAWRNRNLPFLVLSILNGDGEGRGTRAYNMINDLNQRLYQTYGLAYVDIRRTLIQHGQSADDTVPEALRSDHIHLNKTGNQIVAQELKRRIQAP